MWQCIALSSFHCGRERDIHTTHAVCWSNLHVSQLWRRLCLTFLEGFVVWGNPWSTSTKPDHNFILFSWGLLDLFPLFNVESDASFVCHFYCCLLLSVYVISSWNIFPSGESKHGKTCAVFEFFLLKVSLVFSFMNLMMTTFSKRLEDLPGKTVAMWVNCFLECRINIVILQSLI